MRLLEDRKLPGRCTSSVQDSSWADRLELVGDDDRLVGSAGALPLRLLAERTGLRAGLSAAMNRRGFTPLYDRGQLLVDLAVTQLLGGEAISDFQGLRHVAPVIGPIPSNPTVWRALAEVGQLQLARINTAVTVFRRHWWGLLAARPEGFPWLKVAGRELTGITVMDLDASIVFAASEKENAVPTYKGGIGFCPNLASCDNTDDVLAIDPRPAGNATSNDAADNTALLDQAVARFPGRYRRRMLSPTGWGRVLPRTTRTHRRRRQGQGPQLGVLGGLVVHRPGDGRDRPATRPGVDGGDRTERPTRRERLRRRPDRPCSTSTAGSRRSPGCGSWSATSHCTPATANGPPTARKPWAAATS